MVISRTIIRQGYFIFHRISGSSVYQLLERSYTWQREKIQYHWFCCNRHFLAFIFYDTFDLILGFVNAPAFSL